MANLILDFSSGKWATNTDTYHLDDGRQVTVITDTERAAGLERPRELTADESELWGLLQSSHSYQRALDREIAAATRRRVWLR